MMNEKELFPLRSEQPNPKDLTEIINKYLRYWYLFIMGGLIGLGAAYLYCLYNTIPYYSISSTILLKGDKNNSDVGGLGDIGVMGASKNINNEIEVMYSLSLMQRVVSELGLGTSYFVEGRVRDEEIYGKDVPIKVIISQFDSMSYGQSFSILLEPNGTFELDGGTDQLSVHKLGQQVHLPYGIFTVVAAPGVSSSDLPVGKKITVVFQDIKGVAKHYNQAIMIVPKRDDASVLKISLVDPLPEKGKNIINKFIEVYNTEAIEDKNLQAASTIEFLDERLKFITTELSDVEKDVEKFKQANELIDVNSQASQFLDQASDYNRKLADWAVQIDMLESIKKYISSSDNKYKLIPNTLSVQDPTLSGLISKFNELQLERERILRNAFPDNPLILNINEQLENLRINIKDNLTNVKRNLLITGNNLKANSGQFQSKISKVPSMERELLEINRQQAIKNNLYLYLLQKREESALSLAANISNSRIIDPAMATDYPVNTNKQTVYLLCLLIGLGIPLGGIFLKDLLNNKVQSQRDVESLTTTPILGELTHSDTSDTLVVTPGNRSPIVEMIRLIRAKLYFASIDRVNKTMLVTSSMSGEGKTFFCINLGASLALTGKRVVLLELDLRNPMLTKGFGMYGGQGVSDYLVSEDIAVHDIIKPVQEDSPLFVVSSGPIPPDPAELMMSPKLTYLINELKASFDHVIIDTAPIGQVADAFSLSSVIDSTIFLVRYNYTYKKQLSIIDTIYKNKDLSHPMLVLNDANITNDSYGYGYGYGINHKKSSGILNLKP